MPTILLELDPNNMNIEKTYLYANGQVLAQYDGHFTEPETDKYFYLHDRLGSVRQIIDTEGDVNNIYTYDPFGKSFATECTETISNPFMFTGQYYDDEIGQYYLRARMYDPVVMRFTARDPVTGKFTEPITLHKYLYCENDPVDWVDLNGLWKDGLRYYLESVRRGVQDAHRLSDLEIRTQYPAIWNNPTVATSQFQSSFNWHGHSDFGYLLGDFDYTTLDRPGITHPWFFPIGTSLHFRSLEGAFGAEFYVGLALRSGNIQFFEQAMHMGQDYFSHVGRGYDPIRHAFASDDGHAPDNPYIANRAAQRVQNPYYRAANRWTKQWEEQWYIMWDIDKWLSISE